MALVLMILVIAVWRYVSLAAIVAAIGLPVIAWFAGYSRPADKVWMVGLCAVEQCSYRSATVRISDACGQARSRRSAQRIETAKWAGVGAVRDGGPWDRHPT
jgi:hypothetical protein